MIDQLKGIKTILRGHIQSEVALHTANDKDVSNFEYLITMIDQALLENSEARQQQAFDDQVKAIDKNFYNGLITSLTDMERIPPIDQNIINKFIAYCDGSRKLLDTKGVPLGPAKISDLVDGVNQDQRDFIDGDTAGRLNEELSKRILQYYRYEFNELKKLIAANLIIVNYLEREGKPTDAVSKRIDRITRMKDYYENGIEYIQTVPVTEILYLDQWDQNNPGKVTKFTKKALSKNLNINLIQKDLRKLKYEDLKLSSEEVLRRRKTFFLKVKMNFVQNRIESLRKKQGKIIIKQRYIVLTKAKLVIAKLIKERKKLQTITKEHEAYLNKELALKEAKQRQKEYRANRQQTIHQLMTSFSEEASKQQEENVRALDEVNRLRRKVGELGLNIQEELRQQADAYKIDLQASQENSNISIGGEELSSSGDQQEVIETKSMESIMADMAKAGLLNGDNAESPALEELGIPGLDEEDIRKIDPYKKELMEVDKPLVTEKENPNLSAVKSTDSKPQIQGDDISPVFENSEDILKRVIETDKLMPQAKFIETKPETKDLSLAARLANFKHAVIMGFRAFGREIQDDKDNNKLSK